MTQHAMTKDNMGGKAIALTERDIDVIKDVADFGLMSREQIRRRHQFGSVTRVNATLLRLVQHGYLSRRFQPSLTAWRRALYFIGPAGEAVLPMRRDLPGERRRHAHWSDLFVEHQLQVNDVRLRFMELHEDGYRFDQWLAEFELRNVGLDMIPDGLVHYGWAGRAFTAFIEVDRGTESLPRWRHKTRAYLDLAFSGRYEAIFKRRYFRVLVVTPSDRRLNSLGREIAKQTTQIFWLTTFNDLLERGPLAGVWRRPANLQLHALTEG